MLNEVINDLKEIAKNAKSEYLIETLALYLFIAIIFYPPYFETSDSKTYLAQAYLLANGKLYEENHLDAYNLRQMNDKFMSYFPLGQSLWLMPFVKIGFGFVFLSGIIGHLLGWLAFLLILHKMKIKLFYSVFFSFFPSVNLLFKNTNV
ncbi:MAG: hypothetical protein QXX06_03005 [Candidatus Diapherotrites archaeon]